MELVAPPKIDLGEPHWSRVFCYLTGGKDHFAADREFADELVEAWPALPVTVRASRACMARMVRHLAGAGVRQFLDVGCGLPIHPNVHDIAHSIDPAAAVLYVDDDPLVAAHARALLVPADRAVGYAGFVRADARRPAEILAVLPGVFDMRRPVALLLISVLMYFDDDTARTILQTVMAGLPMGSYLAFTHFANEVDPTGGAAAAAELAVKRDMPYLPRDRDQAAALLAGLGLDLVEPGLTEVENWRPDPTPFGGRKGAMAYAAVCRSGGQS